MKAKQDKEINDLKKKLKEFACIKVLVKKNEFKAGIEFDQELFGKLNLVNFNSKILNQQQWMDLMKVCEFSLNEKWTLLYRASEDGFGAKDFHSKCNGKSKTLTIIKADGSSNIFGGFTAEAWDSSGLYKDDPNTFIFSLVNKYNKPIKMNVRNSEFAFGLNSDVGLAFGKYDIFIASNSNSNTNSHSNLGDSYNHPEYAKETDKALNFLAGSHTFKVSEMEVHLRHS